MAEQEEDPERLLRVGKIMSHFKEGLDGQSFEDAQTAIANTVAQLALKAGDSADRAFLHTIDACFEVYRDMSNHVLRNKDEGLS